MMRNYEIKISDFLGSRACTSLMLLLGLLGAMLAYTGADIPAIGTDTGLALPSPNTWLAGKGAAFAMNILLLAVVLVMMEELNREFNLLRTSSPLFLGVFMIMECASPLILQSLTSGLLLTAVVLGVLAAIYSTYLKPRRTKPVFLAFCVLSALSLTDFVYLIYAGAFMLSFSQMRCAGPRMFLAALMGLVTPWWIALGFGWAQPEAVHFPEGINIFNGFPKQQLVMAIVTVGITVIGCFLLCALNMVKIYAYNARSRAMSGLLTMLSLITALAALVNFGNAPEYISLLNCFTAFQLGLFFRSGIKHRAYITVLAVLLIFATLFTLNVCL